MIVKTPIQPERIRRITGSFSWIDHRILSDGFLALMSNNEMLLYFFLVLVGDKNGISFYSNDKICKLLKMGPDELLSARNGLTQKSLIAHHKGLFQVLQIQNKQFLKQDMVRGGNPRSIRDIFRAFSQKK